MKDLCVDSTQGSNQHVACRIQKNRVKHSLAALFLPVGYPNSVKDNYLQFSSLATVSMFFMNTCTTGAHLLLATSVLIFKNHTCLEAGQTLMTIRHYLVTLGLVTVQLDPLSCCTQQASGEQSQLLQLQPSTG